MSRLRLLVLLVAAAMATAAVPVSAVHQSGTSRHIVVLEQGATTSVLRAATGLLAPLGLQPERVFSHALDGFTVVGLPGVVEALELSPLVAHVERDLAVTTMAQSVPVGIDRIGARRVARVGSRAVTDVDIAILDTGIDRHRDLNLHRHVDCGSGGGGTPLLGGLFGLLGGGGQGTDGPACRDGGSDDNGHGTHVAGTAAARDNARGVVGVAPGARLWGVKVMGGRGTGSVSDVIAGIDYVTAHADEIEVANLSLGGAGRSRATHIAIEQATAAGVVVVVAAGNDGANAAGYTPASAPKAITVSAITDLDGRPGGRAKGSCAGRDDAFAAYSNFGPVVDIAAPGSCILSTRDGGGTTRLSGTSMASPHVAGAAAQYIARHRVPRDSRRADRVLAGLLATAAHQRGPCGFSAGRSPEPLLDLDGC